jgi:hypothetical protein
LVREFEIGEIDLLGQIEDVELPHISRLSLPNDRLQSRVRRPNYKCTDSSLSTIELGVLPPAETLQVVG